MALFDLYDQEGILRFTGCDRDACLDYAELFSLDVPSCSLLSIREQEVDVSSSHSHLAPAESSS